MNHLEIIMDMFDSWVIENQMSIDISRGESDIIGDEYCLSDETRRLCAAFNGGLAYQPKLAGK